ncbi:MAG: FRG domain-containing protein [Gemmatimonas sp.]|uniref:FRG domain-containing protein n=1 Tax=Gemmatimonas sp. TaxID=1962908 RepID=UPI0022C38CF9|nr:FRG domain-containing protein [Gemmatimonas sp.]MCZ8013664.1 FRG domain-containing protein [Gemmatimonas sp.]MCZ8267597.1 FRG domain-containing protein [Gemmatimonas sp.]
MSETIDPTADHESPVFTEYFSKIPLWNANRHIRRFEVMADDLSGRIPVTRLESWRDFAQLLESPFFNRHGVQLVFRGHRRHDWGLMPTLGRVTTNGIITERLADEQLERFRRAVRGRLADTALVNEPDELWAVGQHHGLMTPLLDWTYSPYVALFFAFQKEDDKDEKDNPYRAVYVLNKSFLVDNGAETGIRVCEPSKDHHGRLVNQAGLFTFSPYDATLENKLTDVLADEDGFTGEELRTASEAEQPEILARYICKIYIRNEERDACVRHLRRMNVHHASLFPDLIGASEYCNILTAEAEQSAEIARYAAKAAASAATLTTEPVEPATESQSTTTDVTNSIEDVLRAPTEAQQVEPGRIPLIAQELAKIITINKVVDWEKREAVQAQMRTAMRVLLRRYGYPLAAREHVTQQVLEFVRQSSA